MKRYTCSHCGFTDLIDPGERCPGCGYLFSFLREHAALSPALLRASPQEIPIRRLRCAVSFADTPEHGACAQCTLTSRGLRLAFPPDGPARKRSLFLPYDSITRISPGMHGDCPLRCFTYHLARFGALNLCFCADRGVANLHPDIDAQVKDAVLSLLHPQ